MSDHEVEVECGGKRRWAGARVALAVLLPSLCGLGLGLAGCAASGNTGRIDVTVEIDPALALDTVHLEASADDGRASALRDLAASGATSLQWTVIVRNPGTRVSVGLGASGRRGQELLVAYSAVAQLATGETVHALLRLSAKCLRSSCNGSDVTCEDGQCVGRPTFVSGDDGNHRKDAGIDVISILPAEDAGAAGDRPGNPDRPATIDGPAEVARDAGGAGDGAAPACINGASRLCKDDPDLNALGNCGGGVELCSAGKWGACSIAPAAKDSCLLVGDDATCNGKPNEGCPCVDGMQQPCGPAADVGICKRGTQTCAGGTWAACVGAVYVSTRDCTSTADNNCDGVADNALDAVCVCATTTTRPCDEHPGKDGKGRCTAGTQACVVAADRKTSAWGACSGSVAPAASDACTAGNDDNCNGVANEGCVCTEGSRQACGPTAEVGICKRGAQTCTSGAWGACVGAVFAAARDCTSTLDNDCNGSPDNTVDAVCACAAGGTRACGQHPGQDGNGPCKPGSQSCVVATDKKTSTWGACVGSVGPAAADTCDMTNDDNCNGILHDGCTCVNGTTRSCGPAAIGICKPGTQTCANASWGTTCTGAITAKARDCSSTSDNDCNGVPDNLDATCICPAGTTGPCPGNNNPPCKSGTRTCILSADKGSTSWSTTCVGQVLPAVADTCARGNDANCNGTPNDGCQCINEDPPAACPCGTQTCSNGQLNACVISCPGRCVGGTCCAVTPETDAALCARKGIICGALTAVDNCGTNRGVNNCGTCPANASACSGADICNPTGTGCNPNDLLVGSRPVGCQGLNQQCDGHGGCCTGESDAVLCARSGIICGALTSTVDGCGVTRGVNSCGTCPANVSVCSGPDICNPTGTGCNPNDLPVGSRPVGCQGLNQQCDGLGFCVTL